MKYYDEPKIKEKEPVKKKRAFTLIEILVVVAIAVILIALVVGSIGAILNGGGGNNKAKSVQVDTGQWTTITLPYAFRPSVTHTTFEVEGRKYLVVAGVGTDSADVEVVPLEDNNEE